MSDSDEEISFNIQEEEDNFRDAEDASEPNSSTTAASRPPVQYIHVPVLPHLGRRITAFRGDGDDDLDAEDWVEEVRSVVGAMNLSAPQAADFIISYLEGQARRLVLRLSRGQKNTLEKVCDVIVKEFGDTRSVATLRSQLFRKKQGANETTLNYALALDDLRARLTSKATRGEGITQRTFCEAFVEGLHPGRLRRKMRSVLERQIETHQVDHGPYM